jgi:hypothetical protein
MRLTCLQADASSCKRPVQERHLLTGQGPCLQQQQLQQSPLPKQQQVPLSLAEPANLQLQPFSPLPSQQQQPAGRALVGMVPNAKAAELLQHGQQRIYAEGARQRNVGGGSAGQTRCGHALSC